MLINKDTKLFGSFSKKAGNLGCKRFNTTFQAYGINAIYKSFSVENIKDAFDAAKTLDMKGFAVSAPFKRDIIEYLDDYSESVEKTKSCNTVYRKGSLWYGENTDWAAWYDFLVELKESFHIQIYNYVIIGDGAFSRSLQYAMRKVWGSFNDFEVFSNVRKNKDVIQNYISQNSQKKHTIFFNCTPCREFCNFTHPVMDILIESDPESGSGRRLSYLQATKQWKLYGFDKGLLDI